MHYKPRLTDAITCLTWVIWQPTRSAWPTGGRNESALGLFREPEARSITSVSSFVSLPSSSRRRLCTSPFPLFSLASPLVAQRSQGQCAGVYVSHTAVNRQLRLRLPNVFEIIVCAMIRTGWWELWQWTVVPGLCLIQRDWHLKCIILFTFTFFSGLSSQALHSISPSFALKFLADPLHATVSVGEIGVWILQRFFMVPRKLHNRGSTVFIHPQYALVEKTNTKKRKCCV